MTKLCAITGCESKWSQQNDPDSIPMFNLPKNNDLENKWHQSIDSADASAKLKKGFSICIKHFENKFLKQANKLTENAFPTKELKKGNTLIDYEELLSQKPPMKKKRGTSGLMNLQIARKKKLMRRERMQKLAEKRRRAKLEKDMNQKLSKKKSQPIINCNRTSDYFLGDRPETEAQKVVISLRLTSLMKHLYSNKNPLIKHPSSIRDSKTYPIFNKIKNVQELLVNPVYWTSSQVIIFLEHLDDSFPKGIAKRFKLEEINGEAILNLTKSDLCDYLNIDERISDTLSATFQQLRKETIMRYINT